MKLIKKRWKDILLALFILIMVLPQTRKPIQVFIQKIIAMPPSEIDEEERENVASYELLMQTQNGETVNLKEAEGKVILINFWATWCPPCIAEMPDFQKVYQDYKDKVEFFFITNDEWNLVNKFEEKRKYQLPYYKAMSGNETLNASVLPTTFLISKKGEIVMKKTGVADWNSDKFRQMLDDLIQE